MAEEINYWGTVFVAAFVLGLIFKILGALGFSAAAIKALCYWVCVTCIGAPFALMGGIFLFFALAFVVLVLIAIGYCLVAVGMLIKLVLFD